MSEPERSQAFQLNGCFIQFAVYFHEDFSLIFMAAIHHIFEKSLSSDFESCRRLSFLVLLERFELFEFSQFFEFLELFALFEFFEFDFSRKKEKRRTF